MTDGSAPAASGTLYADVETLAPSSEEELAQVLAEATRAGTKVAIWGGGTHREIGYPPPGVDLVVSTAGFSAVHDWEPDDLTVTVGGGMPVAEVEDLLAGARQSAVLPEHPGTATVGGVVATASSGYRRLRHGPTRDRLLEVRAVTGDGRIIKGGARVVKNVTGYDLPRLYVGSLGSLGVITSVCLKLWPLPEATATVAVAGPPPAGIIHRPLAVLETPHGVRVFLAGTAAEIDSQVERLDGEAVPGLDFPAPVSAGSVWSLRARPRFLAEALGRIPSGSDYVAQHGVGEVTFGAEPDLDLASLRTWVEQVAGGSLVRVRGVTELDPWGTPPAGLELQRAIVAAFDPGRILEPGRLPGGI